MKLELQPLQPHTHDQYVCAKRAVSHREPTETALALALAEAGVACACAFRGRQVLEPRFDVGPEFDGPLPFASTDSGSCEGAL